MKNRIFAIPAAAIAIPPKPNTAAMIATIKNSNAQYSIVPPHLLVISIPLAPKATLLGHPPDSERREAGTKLSGSVPARQEGFLEELSSPAQYPSAKASAIPRHLYI
jgi:hypothetical protein